MSNTVTITGTLTDITGTATQGQVVFTLQNYSSQPPIISGSDVIAEVQTTVQANGSGEWSVTLFLNTAITPANTFYSVALSPAGSTTPAITASYSFNTSGTFDLSSLTPLAVIPSATSLIYGQTGPTGPAGPVGTQGIQGDPGSTNVGYVDIQGFGDGPGNKNTKGTTTTVAAGTSGTTLNLAGSNNFSNNGGVVIYKAGNACTISGAPSAPTVALSPSAVTGNVTVSYQIVGVDALGGLTAASSVATVTNAPSIFNPSFVAISSATASAGVVTIGFSSPINAAMGNTIHIQGLTGSGSTWDGCWPVASAPTSSSVTIAISGASGTATVTSAQGRLSNAQQITAISRAANGVVTITTANNHGYTAASGGYNPAFMIVNGVTGDLSFNGYYVIQTASGTTLTCNTGNFTASTGTCVTGAATVQNYEFIRITMPTLATNTVGYYIYSDSASPGNGLNLIARSLANDTNYLDFGPLFQSGFTAPSYVPTTPPSSQQNQMFGAIIVSGGGTTTLTLGASIPNPSTGQTVGHDDAQALIAAIAYARSQTNSNAGVTLSAPTAPTANPIYFFRYPVSIPSGMQITLGTSITLLEPWTLAGYNTLDVVNAPAWGTSGQFGLAPYAVITSYASPAIVSNGGLVMKRILLAMQRNASWGLQIAPNAAGDLPIGESCLIENCFFSMSDNFTSAIPVTINNTSGITFRDCQFAGGNVLGESNSGGNSSMLPFFPLLYIHWASTASDGCGSIAVKGQTSFSRRGILLDQYGLNAGSNQYFEFGGDNGIDYQGPTTPFVTLWGTGITQSKISDVFSDSTAAPIFANFGVHTSAIKLERVYSPGGNAVCGYYVNGLEFIDVQGVGVGNQPTRYGQTQVYSRIIGGTITTSGGSSDSLTIPGVGSLSIPQYSAGNSSAATDIKNGNVFISISGDVITLTHGTTSGMIFYVTATAGF